MLNDQSTINKTLKIILMLCLTEIVLEDEARAGNFDLKDN